MEELKKHLVNSLKGGHAFVTIEKALKDVNPEKRNIKTDKNLHTIWEELEHLRLAQEDIYQYMINPKWKSPKWPEGYWSDPVDELKDEEWDKTHSGFFTDLNNVIKLVNDSKIDLLKIIPHTTAHTYLREILLIIEHNAYHIGKIVDIRKALRDWQNI
jgi:hypothetical protein